MIISSKKHLTHIIRLFIVFCVLSMVYAGLNYREFIYPERHLTQQSPKQYVAEKSKQLPTQLPKPEVIEHGDRNKKIVALTFDADMTYAMQEMLKRGIVKSWYNAPIKQTLDSESVKATVFFSGLWVEIYPKEAYELAHDPLIEIGNHSYSHPGFTKNCYNLPFLDNQADNDEVIHAQNAIERATGIKPKYFRFPGGCFEKVDLESISQLGLTIVHWDVASGDAFSQNPDEIVSRVLHYTQNGSIIVFHIHDSNFAPKTNDALVKIIPELKKRGFEFVTISEMLKGQ
jgi:peptidoglycan/xylan/chitin deacetylase (PgdA/CDA1 family)